MDFTLTADQTALLAALERIAAPFTEPPADFRTFALESTELEDTLDAAGIFDVAETLGPVAAALCVERLARLPYAAEIALSMLVRPQLKGSDWPRPLAFVEDGRPSRFLARARTVLVASRDTLAVAAGARDMVAPLESIYAYPMAKLIRELASKPLPAQDAPELRKWLRVALASEAAGLMKAALDSTVAHVSVRKQFGRPLGSFQALQHRLAECAVLAGGVRWLALKAASTADDGDAALAAFHAQESTARITYDLHQMLGAMGMTLEHPLHLWTYRLKALQSELGGRGAHAQAVAQLCFP